MNRLFRNACLLTLGLAACSTNQDQKVASESAQFSELADTTKDETIRLYALPVPLQTAEYLTATEVPFDESLLYNVSENTSASTVFYDAIELGIAMVDISYLVSYSNHDKVAPYMARVKELSDRLNIKDPSLLELSQRFEQHKQYPDSLKQILMDGFESGYAFFQQNQREGTGLLVIVGVFVEGLHHLLNTSPQDFEREALMAYHQKNFVNNISELLERVDEVDGVSELKTYFTNLSSQMEIVGVINHGIKLQGDTASWGKLPIEMMTTELEKLRTNLLQHQL